MCETWPKWQAASMMTQIHRNHTFDRYSQYSFPGFYTSWVQDFGHQKYHESCFFGLRSHSVAATFFMTWQLISSTGFKAIYTRLPAAAQEGAPLVNVAHNFETERHPNLHHVADTHALAFRFQKWKSFFG